MTTIDWVTIRRRFSWPRGFFIALLLAVVLTLAVGAMFTLGPFEPFNPTWEGTSEFREEVVLDGDHAGELLRSTDRYDDLPGEGTTSFVIAPEDQYDTSAAAPVAAFVERGGTLVVMDNFGNQTNPLLADLGVETRLDGRVLRDERVHHRSPTMPLATTVEPHPWTTGIDQLTLNLATAVESQTGTMLIGTSETGYLGELEDSIDEEDELQVYPVVVSESLGSGEVVVVGDPSITINEMIAEPDNRVFLDGIVTDADRVVFDLSHGGSIPPVQHLLLVVRASTTWQLLVGIGAILGVALLVRRVPDRTVIRRMLPEELTGRLPPWLFRPDVGSPTLDQAERYELLRKRYPSWDERRIERIITALNHSSDEVDHERR